MRLTAAPVGQRPCCSGRVAAMFAPDHARPRRGADVRTCACTAARAPAGMRAQAGRAACGGLDRVLGAAGASRCRSGRACSTRTPRACTMRTPAPSAASSRACRACSSSPPRTDACAQARPPPLPGRRCPAACPHARLLCGCTCATHKAAPPARPQRAERLPVCAVGMWLSARAPAPVGPVLALAQALHTYEPRMSPQAQEG